MRTHLTSIGFTLLLSHLVDGFEANDWRKGLIDRIIELMGCRMHLSARALFIELICYFHMVCHTRFSFFELLDFIASSTDISVHRNIIVGSPFCNLLC